MNTARQVQVQSPQCVPMSPTVSSNVSTSQNRSIMFVVKDARSKGLSFQQKWNLSVPWFEKNEVLSDTQKKLHKEQITIFELFDSIVTEADMRQCCSLTLGEILPIRKGIHSETQQFYAGGHVTNDVYGQKPGSSTSSMMSISVPPSPSFHSLNHVNGANNTTSVGTAIAHLSARSQTPQSDATSHTQSMSVQPINTAVNVVNVNAVNANVNPTATPTTLAATTLANSSIPVTASTVPTLLVSTPLPTNKPEMSSSSSSVLGVASMISPQLQQLQMVAPQLPSFVSTPQQKEPLVAPKPVASGNSGNVVSSETNYAAYADEAGDGDGPLNTYEVCFCGVHLDEKRYNQICGTNCAQKSTPIVTQNNS